MKKTLLVIAAAIDSASLAPTLIASPSHLIKMTKIIFPADSRNMG
jgi:hypothetical protein